MQLSLFNTLTRQKEVFKPLRAGHVGIYTCGPTVYARAHLGNLRSYLFPDLLRRVSGALGLKVYQVLNITDVGHLTSDADSGEDKLELAARKEARSAWEIARANTDYFWQDLAKLGIAAPEETPRATDHIAEQITLIRQLEDKGYTYRTEDGIYFRTAKFKDYGRLAQLDIEGLQAGARVGLGSKEEKTDFALWKITPTHVQRQMEWDSPWGRGFPGWHIECSAMAMKYLGDTLDIHTGGTDHIPVHHTNEICQSEAASGKPFVRYWLHGAFLVLDQARMGKSEGNMLGLEQLAQKGIEPLAFRYFALNSHYRQYLRFSWPALQAADTALIKLRGVVQAIFQASGLSLVKEIDTSRHPSEPIHPRDKWQESLSLALCDDLNAPKALGLLWQFLYDEKLTVEQKCGLASWAESLLGIGLLDFSRLEALPMPAEVISLAEARAKARGQENWSQADALRDQLLEAGYLVKDSPSGYSLERLKKLPS